MRRNSQPSAYEEQCSNAFKAAFEGLSRKKMTTPSGPAKASGSGRSKWVAIAVVVVVVIAGLAYFFLYSAGPTIRTVAVGMPNGVGSNQGLNFQPATITVVIGVNNTVVWTNQDTVSHTVQSTTAPVSFGSATSLIGTSQSFSFTFTTPGTYNYFCSIHPSWMKGTIIVKAKS